MLKGKPFVKWAGGKRQIIDKLKEYIPEEFGTYYEPFVGGGALLFELSPKNAVINDSNKELMNVFSCIKDEDKFIDYLYKDSDNSTKVVDKNKGKYSELSYKVLQRDKKNNLALVDIELETGRHHQIRVQFASRNHALYGDQRYGIQDKNQIALHAYKLEFIHPTTKEKLVFESKTLIRSKWSNFEI